MSIIQLKKNSGSVDVSELAIDKSKLTPDKYGKIPYALSQYQPTDEEKSVRSMIIQHFMLGYLNMYTPRVEFNDLSVIDRMQVDQMGFNTYQPNNGQPAEGDVLNSWKSNAMKPIVRNKIISVAAHATARLIFPKVFAYNDNNEVQHDAAQVMRDLLEWSADQSNYENTSLYANITALTDPASIVYTEYNETYRNVKRERVNGKYVEETIIDETLSGFHDQQVPVDELFIENFYEPDIQKQGFLIWRRVFSYSLAEAKYKNLYPNFKYVTPGVQTIYNDANSTFYQVYDANMRQYDVEEVIYYNRTLDLKIIMVNGVMLTECDNANPRIDKLYPFVKFGYEIINNRCFYYKSLAFKLQQDANIVNTLYQIIIDGSYLNVFPAMIATGGEAIGSDVIVPGAVTTFADPNSDLRPIQSANLNGLQIGQQVLDRVSQSVEDSSISNMSSGQSPLNNSSPTAYQISRLEQNSATVLGLFIKMISTYVKSYGKLRLGDILQYMTIADVEMEEENPILVYKTFLLKDKTTSQGRVKSRKIVFDHTLPDEPISKEEQLKHSYQVLKEQGGMDSKTELYKVNPSLFRMLRLQLSLDADILNPKSEDLERAYDLETYDRMIQNPEADQEQTYRLLLSTNPKTSKDPDKYITQQQQQGQQQQGQPVVPPAQRGKVTPTMQNGLPQNISPAQLHL